MAIIGSDLPGPVLISSDRRMPAALTPGARPGEFILLVDDDKDLENFWPPGWLSLDYVPLVLVFKSDRVELCRTESPFPG